MPNYANNICYLVQKAARLYLQAETLSFIPNAQILQGLSAAELKNTRVFSQCVQMEASTQFEGNWAGPLRIYLYDNADDVTEDAFHAKAGELFSKFMCDPETLANNLSNALAGFTAQFVYPQAQGWGVKDRQWFAYIELRLDGACGSDIDIS